MMYVLIVAAASFVLALGLGVVLKPWVDRVARKFLRKSKD